MIATAIMPLLLAMMLQSSAAIEQVGPAAGSERQDVPEQVVVPRTGTERLATDQLDRAGKPSQSAQQLTSEVQGKEVDQAGRRDRNMQSSPDLSNRSQGFETRVVKLEGTDRCSAELPSARDREYCRQVIENRSADFGGPKPVELTPEQKLLGERNFKLIEGGTDSAIKRLASGRNSSENSDDQAVASVALEGRQTVVQPAPEPVAGSKLSTETQALLEAIVKNIGNGPGS